MSSHFGPCLCGAPDCIKCFPSNFENGRYKYCDCRKCGSEFHPDEEGDTLCPDCANLNECTKCGDDYDPDDCVDCESELCPPCEAEKWIKDHPDGEER